MSNLERPKPYIGISGVVNVGQQEQLETLSTEMGISDFNRRLALGVKAVHKTQFLDISNKYGEEWYPVGQEQFANALVRSADTSQLFAVAQTFLDPEYIENPGYRDHFSDRIFKRGENWIDGIQFDMLPWHTDAAMSSFLERLKSTHDATILLQCHGDAMESLGPQKAVRRLGELASTIDYVLFDASHGTGKRLDTDRLKTFLDEAYGSTALEGVGFAIAGGLNGTVVREELAKVIQDFPDISWDAEGQLHPQHKNRARPLDMNLVQDYLQASRDTLEA
jgi:hypothetical protein